MKKVKITEAQLAEIAEMLKITDTDANSGSIKTDAQKTAQTINNNGLSGLVNNPNKNVGVSINDKNGELGFGRGKDVTVSNRNSTNESILTLNDVKKMRKEYIREHSEIISIKDFLKKIEQ